VVVNGGEASSRYAFDLSRFPGRPASSRAYRTSATEDAKSIGPVALTGSTLAAEVPARSITTFVLDGVTVGVLPKARGGRVSSRGLRFGSAIATPVFGTSKACCMDAAGRLAPPGAEE